MLGLLVLASHDDAQVLAVFRLVGDTHSRIRRVDTLSAWTGGTKNVNTEIGWIDIHLDLFGFRQNGDGHSRGMDTPLGFSDRHTLHAVRAALKFELAVDILALDGSDDFFKATGLRRAGTHDVHAPALRIGIATIHAKQVRRKERRLIPTGASADLHDHATLVIRVTR